LEATVAANRSPQYCASINGARTVSIGRRQNGRPRESKQIAGEVQVAEEIEEFGAARLN